MKKLIAISVIVLLSGFIKAQGTLQFDHVHFEQLVSTSGSDPTLTFTIPSGQVFKLTSAQLFSSSYYSLGFKKSSESIYSYLISSSTAFTSLPVWMPAGSYNFKLTNSHSSHNVSASFSGIFFNIIPAQ